MITLDIIYIILLQKYEVLFRSSQILIEMSTEMLLCPDLLSKTPQKIINLMIEDKKKKDTNALIHTQSCQVNGYTYLNLMQSYTEALQ